MNYKDITISIFSSCKSNRSNQTTNIWEWLLMRKDSSGIIQSIRETSDAKEIGRLKRMLPCATMSGIFRERKADKIESGSGLICIDVDGKDNPEITDVEVLKEISAKLDCVLYSGLSVSGKGIFCLIPLSNPQRHMEHYYALERDFKDLGITIDPSCTDISRLRFQSYDPSPYVNPGAIVYDKFLNESTVNRIKRNNTSSVNRVYLNSDKKEASVSDISMEEMLLKPSIDLYGDEIIPVYPLYVYSDDDKRDSILRMINRVVNSKTDITVESRDWITVGEVIKRYFGESGRSLFHEISQFYSTDRFHYTYSECDEKFNQILKSKYTYGYERIFEVSRKYGFS